MARRFALIEAAVSCGSPTRGSEGAYPDGNPPDGFGEAEVKKRPLPVAGGV